MKRISVLILVCSILALASCAPVTFSEGIEGVPSSAVYDGSCVDDHFDNFFECASLERGGSPAD